jgi:endonuclease/exonuclease/phosphatase family metal-dependent hydrolase
MSVSSISSRGRGSGVPIRLYTHNIWGRHGDWPARRMVLIEGIHALDPDLITLQETIVLDDYDQVADLLGDGWHIAHSRERAPDGTGISIASRWPITAVHEPGLNVTPRTGDFDCTAIIAEIDAPAPFGPFLLVNHFPDYQVDHERERELQTVLVARAIEDRIARQPTHVLLSGDLDAEPDAASLRFLSGKQSLDGISVCYRSAWDAVHPGEPGGTFVAANPLAPDDWPYQRIDHILIRCGEHGGPTLRIAGCELAFNEPVGNVWASDHFGLVADFLSVSDQGQSVPGGGVG